MSRERPLSYRDTAKVLARLGGDLSIVLVGGQAVNFWAEHYRTRALDLGDGPFTSADIDFTGTRQEILTSAKRLGGTALLPEAFAPPPSSGIVIFRDDDGFEHTIDFLMAVYGVDDGVDRRSVPIEMLDEHGAPTGVRFRVMQPVDCLWSRVHNVTGLPGYDTRHGMAQARAAVVCARVRPRCCRFRTDTRGAPTERTDLHDVRKDSRGSSDLREGARPVRRRCQASELPS